VRQQPTNETASLSPQDNGQPPYLYPAYVSTRLRAPKATLIILPKTLSDTTGPAYGRGPVGELAHDLTRQHEGEPLGERIIVTGRVTDGDGHRMRGSLIEIWQANAASRYTHHRDRPPGPA
jgi:protocatechuate 3,4-dioxygenase beta subunit